MSLSASMWTSVSGLLAHGEKMSVVGNNISNINTLGFKSQRMDFEDFVYQQVGTANGMGQVGRGTSIGIIMNDFAQGAIETTTSSTDVAIYGNGFFRVRPLNNNMDYYTRAGNFSFNKDGYLVDPHGYVLQGWEVDANSRTASSQGRSASGIIGVGSPTDIKLDTFTCPPKHTENATIQVNLPKGVDDKSTVPTATNTNPFFSLLQKWDNTQTTPLGSSSYVSPVTMDVYDESGKLHTLTIYFDRVKDSATQDITNNSISEEYWEYVVTMNPAEDVRDFTSFDGNPSTPTTPNVPEKLKGLLAAGTMTFTTGGDITDMSCFVPQSTSAAAADMWWTGSGSTAAVNLNKWVAAPFNSDGFPMIAPNFSGTSGQGNAYLNTDFTKPNQNAEGRLIALDFGLRNTTDSWTFNGLAGTGPGTPKLVTAADVKQNKNNTYGMNGNSVKQNLSMMNRDNGFYEMNKRQDGYTYGNLRSVSVSADGVLTGSYTNGETLLLYQITLYDFPSEQNLRREGGNLFTETRESGMSTAGAPGTGAFGSTRGNALEQSNADLSREFVNMITTQRGFQANSKTITTVDTMLETVISMKR